MVIFLCSSLPCGLSFFTLFGRVATRPAKPVDVEPVDLSRVPRRAATAYRPMPDGETGMEFYSFRLGEMKVAQADAASPKTMAVEMTLGFRAPEQHTVETIELTVHVPHDPDKTVSAAEGDAYRMAQRLLRAAADHCASRDVKQLCEETERNKAFVIGTSS